MYVDLQGYAFVVARMDEDLRSIYEVFGYDFAGGFIRGRY